VSDTPFCCEQMRGAVSSAEIPIVYTARFREIGIRVLDGGSSFIVMMFCPWCGKKLPPSLRDEWFDALESRGIDPYADEIPPEFSDERWYKGAQGS
jgi:hypothetical protein